mgnify:CR=1 FL=1
MNKEEILYEKAGLIYTEHPKVIEAMTEFAKQYHKEQLILSGVSNFVIQEIERRRDLILSEPDGMVREQMINNLALEL